MRVLGLVHGLQVSLDAQPTLSNLVSVFLRGGAVCIGDVIVLRCLVL